MMTLNVKYSFRQVDGEIDEILRDTAAAGLGRLINEWQMKPITNTFILEHFGATSLEELSDAQLLELMEFVWCFRSVAHRTSQ